MVLIEGRVQESLAATEIDGEVGDAFAAKAGFDPRELTTPYRYFWICPKRVQAWREANELEGREIMRGEAWLV